MNGLDLNNIWSNTGWLCDTDNNNSSNHGRGGLRSLVPVLQEKAGIMVVDKEATEELEKEESKKRTRRRKGQ
jgi:hypothetical protein